MSLSGRHVFLRSEKPRSLLTLRVCPDCGMVSSLAPPHAGYDNHCPRCNRILRRGRQHPIRWTLALAVSGLLFYAVALTAPFLTVLLYGRARSSTMMTGISVFGEENLWVIGSVVLFTAVIMPLVKLVGLLVVFAGLQRRHSRSWLVPLFRNLRYVNAWAMGEIFLLGFLVAYTRLHALAQVHVDMAVFAFIGLVLSMVSIDTTLVPEAIWAEMHKKGLTDVPDRPPQAALIGCDTCHQANEVNEASCVRCGATLHERKPNSLARTLALTLTAALFYIPANVYPVMEVTRLRSTQSYTIYRGLDDFLHAGLWPLALLVFVASMAIPASKLIALGFLMSQTRSEKPVAVLLTTRIYRLIDFIGRWSMIDIFMLSILVGLMRFGEIAHITAGAGALYFSAVVVFTMLAVESFDPRLIWDQKMKGLAR